MDRTDQWLVPEKVYDSHCHYFSYNTLERFAEQRNYKTVEELIENWNFKDMKIEIPPKDPQKLADRWIQELDTKGCDKAVLFPEINQIDNVKVAVEEYPDRFIPYIMLNPFDEKIDGMELLEAAISKIGIKGFKLYPPLHYYHAYDERLIPFYETAQDNNLCITFHFGVSVGRSADLRYMSPVDLSPIARDFPKINFLLAHFATGFLRELLFLMYHVDNVYAESSSSNVWIKYLPYEIKLQDVFEKIIDLKGYQKIVFGTDSSFLPRGWRSAIYKHQLSISNELGLNQQEIDGIFWKNLSRLMDI